MKGWDGAKKNTMPVVGVALVLQSKGILKKLCIIKYLWTKKHQYRLNHFVSHLSDHRHSKRNNIPFLLFKVGICLIFCVQVLYLL